MGAAVLFIKWVYKLSCSEGNHDMKGR